MRYFLYTFLFLLTVSLWGARTVVSIDIYSKDKAIPDDFKIGIEEKLTASGYYLCEGKSCKNTAFKIKVEIIKKSNKVYRFNARFLDLKHKRIISVKTLYFKGSLQDYEHLMSFGRNLTDLMISNVKKFATKKSEAKESKIIKSKAKTKKSVKGVPSHFHKVNALLEKNANLPTIKPIQNKSQDDIFYNSVISHPHIIKFR